MWFNLISKFKVYVGTLLLIDFVACCQCYFNVLERGPMTTDCAMLSSAAIKDENTALESSLKQTKNTRVTIAHRLLLNG